MTTNVIWRAAFRHIIALDLFVMHQSGIYAGPDYSVNYWPPLDRLLQNFPRLKLVLAHGGYPAVIDALALAVKHPNFYLSPDIDCFAPAGRVVRQRHQQAAGSVHHRYRVSPRRSESIGRRRSALPAE